MRMVRVTAADPPALHNKCLLLVLVVARSLVVECLGDEGEDEVWMRPQAARWTSWCIERKAKK